MCTVKVYEVVKGEVCIGWLLRLLREMGSLARNLCLIDGSLLMASTRSQEEQLPRSSYSTSMLSFPAAPMTIEQDRLFASLEHR